MGNKSRSARAERRVAKKISLWWSNDESDFIFWRSNSSGAHATQRRKRGKQTKGHHGDLCHVHPSGKPLIDLLMIENKLGYQKSTIADLIDRSDSAKLQQYEEWILKARIDAKRQGSFTWMIIHERSRREYIALFPEKLFRTKLLARAIARKGHIPTPWLQIRIVIKNRPFNLICMKLDNLLSFGPKAFGKKDDNEGEDKKS